MSSGSPRDPIAEIVARLNELGLRPREHAGKWSARCPAHEDRRNSFSLDRGTDGRALVYCHAGCTYPEIMGRLGLPLAAAFADERRGTKDAAAAKPKRPSDRPAPPPRDWSALAARCRTNLTPARLGQLAENLGVKPEALELLGTGWATTVEIGEVCGPETKLRAGWTFPMIDAKGQVVGICLRTPSAFKITMTGGRLGLFVPSNLAMLPDPVLVPEGASDVAAALSAGYAAVGRPSNLTGAPHLAELLRGRRVLICGENDQKPDGKWPGKTGAESVALQLAEVWGEPVSVAMPPEGHKDFRAWMRSAGGPDQVKAPEATPA